MIQQYYQKGIYDFMDTSAAEEDSMKLVYVNSLITGCMLRYCFSEGISSPFPIISPYLRKYQPPSHKWRVAPQWYSPIIVDFSYFDGLVAPKVDYAPLQSFPILSPSMRITCCPCGVSSIGLKFGEKFRDPYVFPLIMVVFWGIHIFWEVDRKGWRPH